MSVVQIDSKDNFDTLSKENTEKLVVVDFYADWCGPCKLLGPKLEEFAKEHEDVVFCKVNVDDVDDFATEHAIRALPTVMFFKGGKELKKVVGMKMPEIEEAISTHS